MKTRFTWSLLALLFAAAGCGNGHGTDSLFAPKSTSGCVTCHNSTSGVAPDPLVTNGSGTYGKHVSHVQSAGIPCERCHYDYSQRATHMNGTLDTGNPAILIVYFDSLNPSGIWTNDTGPGTGTCASVTCHGGYPVDWYGTGTPACAACHFAQMGSRRPVLGPNGDFGANAAMLSHHVTGTADPTAVQCQVCHEMSQHMGGVVRLKQADSGTAIAYDPADPRTLEPFCLSCHDATGAGSTFASGGTPTAPFNDGSALGSGFYPFGLRIATSWSGTHGHGPNGGHAPGDVLTCLGTGQPGSGCHGNNGLINAHGSANRLLAARTYNYDNDTTYSESDFALCFNCHAGYPGVSKEDILGVKQGGILDSDYGFLTGGNGTNGWNPPYYTLGVVTRFRDHNEASGAYNDLGTWWSPDANLHWAHLGYPSDYRAGAVIGCISCHDVHGSSNVHGATYAEIGYSYSDCSLYPGPGSGICTALGPELLGAMTDSAYNTTLLDNSPTFCAFNCHSIQGPTKAWFEPLAE